MTVTKKILPSMTSLSLDEVLAMDLRGYQITQKMDGRTAVKSIGGFDVVGEQMADGSFLAFDVCQDSCLRVRWTTLHALSDTGLQIVPCGYGKEFVEAVFADTKAEGVVIKNWDAPFATDWAKCKRVETFDVRVIGKIQGAVEIEFENQFSGKVALSGPNYDFVQIGSVIEIAAFRRNVSGKFREPRFVRIHPSKV